ncbi:MAG: LCP family protein [Oscillospiraceae bacterium]|jgi:LCP family protein required for cell wall assembly|nr:LCP family protein [Oscillospiraceae bacterium]
MKLFSQKPVDREETPKADDDIKLYNPNSEDSEPTDDEQAEIDALISAHQKKKLIRRSVILGIVVIVAVFAFLAIRSIRPPSMNFGELETHTPAPGETPLPPASGSPEASPSEGANASGRNEKMFTFIIAGEDDGTGNTDTIMAGAYDMEAKKLTLISIPRDTIVNVPWQVKKASTMVYSGSKHYKITQEESLEKHAKDFLGFTPDSYFLISLKAFSKIVDTIGGVDFTVPTNMNYEDPDQHLSIHISKGFHHLNGTDAMKVARFRATYAGADITRIGVQHDLFTAIAKQAFRPENLLKVNDFAKIFAENVKTDLTVGNIAWYAGELMGMDTSNIEFLTMPANTNDYLNGISGCMVYVDEWLKMLNEKLNPYNTEITERHINVITRDAKGKAYATNGDFPTNWIGSGGTSSTPKPSSSTPKPAANSPAPGADPAPAPVPLETPPPPVAVSPDYNDNPDVVVITPDPGLMYTPPPVS